MSDARDAEPGPGEQTGEAVGGIGGTLAGAGIGSAAGPVGTLVGALAGAVGGWWAGEKAGRALEDWSEETDRYYRRHFLADSRPEAPESYEEARIGYVLGHMAGINPDYHGRTFDAIEPHLRDAWAYEPYGYDAMRPYVHHGWRTTSRPAEEE